jgi:hypothetical protein
MERAKGIEPVTCRALLGGNEVDTDLFFIE